MVEKWVLTKEWEVVVMEYGDMTRRVSRDVLVLSRLVC